MRANISVPARSPRLVYDRIADPYMRVPRLSEPAVCPDCGAVFHGGRWQWMPQTPTDAARESCQACRRIKDDFPAGIMTLYGTFLRPHLGEILAVARNQEQAEKMNHPLHRIMGIEEYGDKVVIKTTDIHLPHRIGRALRRSYKGELSLKHDSESYFVRGWWRRES